MNIEQVVDFLILLGVDDATSMENSRRVTASCPLARWLHRPENLRTQSLVVRVSEMDHAPRFHCSVCGAKGSLLDLLHELQTLSTELFPEATALIAQWDGSFNLEASKPPRRIRVDLPPPALLALTTKGGSTIEAEELEHFPLLLRSDQRDVEIVTDWLQTTWNVSPAVIRRSQLRLYYDAITKEPGVAVPIFSPESKLPSELWGYPMDDDKGRLITLGRGGNPGGTAASPIFGLERLDHHSPAFLVQHPLSAFKLESMRLTNVVATLPTGQLDLTPLERCPCVYLAFDDTPSGRDLTRKAFRLLNHTRIIYLRWSEAVTATGKGLRSPQDLDNLNQLKQVFDRRIALSKRN